MKKLLLLFIAFITLASVSYASFPIENNTVLIAKNLVIEGPNDEEQEDPSWWVLIYILNAIILISGTYLLLRTFWRAWEKRKWWARKLIPLLILISLPTFLIGYIGHLISIVLLILLGMVLLYKRLIA